MFYNLREIKLLDRNLKTLQKIQPSIGEGQITHNKCDKRHQTPTEKKTVVNEISPATFAFKLFSLALQETFGTNKTDEINLHFSQN